MINRHNRISSTGFTLVELSIVLVIIGLLIGGILVGQSLIESAKIMRTVKDATQYQILMKQFKERYKYFPGDIPNAYSMFGDTCGPNAIKGGIPFQAPGCNGDGNGWMGCCHPAEIDNIVLHLSLSGMLNKKYTSLQADQKYIAGGNSPVGQFPNTIYRWASSHSDATTVYSFGLYSITGPTTLGQSLIPALAGAIDAKMDDGIPDTGLIRSENNLDPTGCTTGGGISGNYNMTTKVASCSPVFITPPEYR